MTLEMYRRVFVTEAGEKYVLMCVLKQRCYSECCLSVK